MYTGWSLWGAAHVCLSGLGHLQLSVWCLGLKVQHLYSLPALLCTGGLCHNSSLLSQVPCQATPCSGEPKSCLTHMIHMHSHAFLASDSVVESSPSCHCPSAILVLRLVLNHTLCWRPTALRLTQQSCLQPTACVQRLARDLCLLAARTMCTGPCPITLPPPPSAPPCACAIQDHQSHSGAEHTRPDSVQEYQPPMHSDTAHSCSPLPKRQTGAHKSAVSVGFAATSLQPSSHSGGVLSPRASLDLSLHPDNHGECIVRISADPERAHYPEDFTQDTLIEDPTTVAVLEHAFQPNTTHPVFHVHMPSRHHSHAPSEADSEDHQGHSFAASLRQAAAAEGHEHAASDGDHLQPLLHGAHHQQHGHESGTEDVGVWQRWRKLLGNPQAVPFFAMSLLMGFGTGILSVFLFLYLDELGELVCYCIIMPMNTKHCRALAYNLKFSLCACMLLLASIDTA